MLRRLIDTSYRFAKIDQNQVLRAFVETRSRVNNHLYGLQANQKRIDFSYREYYSPSKNRNNVEHQNTDRNEKDKKGWNIASFSLIAASIMAYLLINSQASAEQEENENELETNGVESNVHLDILSKKLAANLPSPIEDYVDFQGKKELLDQRLKIQDIVIISGAGGMGKSTLATQYSNECQQRGDTQVIWIKGTQIEAEFFRLAGLLGIETNGLNRELIRNLVYGNLQMHFGRKDLLFIFDNVETKEKIENYLINLPNTAKVIITARNKDLLEGIKPLRVKGFKKEEASFFLMEVLKISEAEAEKIINVAGASPFRLSIIGAYLKNYPLMSVDELTEKYLQIKRGHSENEEIYPEVEMLFRNLKKGSPKGWELLKNLAYLDAEGVSVRMMGKIMDQTFNELQEAINKLKELSLVKVNERKVKVTHRIVQEETKKALQEEDRTQEAQILGRLIEELNKEWSKVDEGREVAELMRHAKIIVNTTDASNKDITDLLNKIGTYHYSIDFNFKEAKKYFKKELNAQQRIHKSNHPLLAHSLNKVAKVYIALKGKENIRKALKYQEEALKMNQALFPDDHPDVAGSFNDMGFIYQALGGEENKRKGLKYQEEALKMYQALFPENHPDVARSFHNIAANYLMLGGENNFRKGLKYQKKALKMRQALFPENHPSVAISLNNIGIAYEALGGAENRRKGLKYQEKALEMFQALFPENHPDVANLLNNVGCAYKALGGEENKRKGLQYQEKSLKMYQALFPNNHPYVAQLLNDVGIDYEDLGDTYKALEYFKQAYSMSYVIRDSSWQEMYSNIKALQPLYPFGRKLNQEKCHGGNRIGSECRWIIHSRGETNDSLLELKKKIQSNVLNKVVESVEPYKWSHIGWLSYEQGVKRYVEKSYLKKQLGELGNTEDNIEVAQMLTFEAMNLGIMKSEKKPYSIVQEFTRNDPELVKKIAQEHPEFFIDGSIVEACVKAIPHDSAFEEHLLKHVKYMGMEARKERGFENFRKN